jgi:uncharacterized protein (DUF58 family)
MIDLEFLKQLKKLDLLAKKKVISSYVGGQRSLRQGRGIEPVDHREYFPGDDLKFVDWKVYGRTEKLFIKRFEEEKSLTTHILVDASNSMNFKTGRYTKYDFASMLAMGFAYLVTRENEKFAVATYNTGLRDVMQPRRGKGQFFRAIDLLDKQKLGGMTNLEKAADKYADMIRTRSLCVLISDFLEPIETIKKGIIHISKKSRNMIVIHVADPAEKRFELQGDVKLYDLETDKIKKVFFTPELRRQYGIKFMAHIEHVKRVCDDVEADFFSVADNEPIFDVFFKITHMATRGHERI